MQQKVIKISIIIIAAALLITAAILLFSKKSTPIAADTDLIYDSFPLAPTEGNANAKNSILIMEDLNCPFCQDFHKTNYAKLVNDYVKPGKAKIKVVIVKLHPKTPKAITLAYCLAKQNPDYYQSFTHYIYTTFEAENPTPAHLAFFANPLSAITSNQLTLKGLDQKKLTACIAQDNMKAVADAYTKKATNLAKMYQWTESGLSTPLLIINGKPYNWNNYNLIKQALDN